MSWNLIIYTTLSEEKLRKVVEKLDDLLDDAGVQHSKRVNPEINELDQESRDLLAKEKTDAESKKEIPSIQSELFFENPNTDSPIEHGSIRYLLKALKNAVVHDDRTEKLVHANAYLKATDKVQDLEKYLEAEANAPAAAAPVAGTVFYTDLEKSLRGKLEEQVTVTGKGQKIEIRCSDDDFPTLIAKGKDMVRPTLAKHGLTFLEVIVRKDSNPGQSFGFEVRT